MNKNDLITAVAEASGLSKNDSSSAVEGVFEFDPESAVRTGTKFAWSGSGRSPSLSARHRRAATRVPANR